MEHKENNTSGVLCVLQRATNHKIQHPFCVLLRGAGSCGHPGPILLSDILHRTSIYRATPERKSLTVLFPEASASSQSHGTSPATRKEQGSRGSQVSPAQSQGCLHRAQKDAPEPSKRSEKQALQPVFPDSSDIPSPGSRHSLSKISLMFAVQGAAQGLIGNETAVVMRELPLRHELGLWVGGGGIRCRLDPLQVVTSPCHSSF